MGLVQRIPIPADQATAFLLARFEVRVRGFVFGAGCRWPAGPWRLR
jgi:hypothetical protein